MRENYYIDWETQDPMEGMDTESSFDEDGFELGNYAAPKLIPDWSVLIASFVLVAVGAGALSALS